MFLNKWPKETQMTLQLFLTQFVNGKEGAEFATLLDKLDRAFGPGAVGGGIGLETKEQILGALGGVNFIENKLDILSAAGISRGSRCQESRRCTQENRSTLEAAMTKRVGDAKAKQAMKQLFQQDSMKYKALLNQIYPRVAQKVLLLRSKSLVWQ